MTTKNTNIPIEWAIYMALIFVALIIVVTAILLLCYWYNCMKAIYIWMGIAVALLLSFYVWLGIGDLPKLFNIPVDYIGVAIFVYNLVVVGIMAIFWRAPSIVTQFFMIFISVLTSMIFLTFPDWTIWILLVLLIFYDMTVVLCPNGLLNLIIQKTEERGDALPALIYSSAAYTWKDKLGDEEEDVVYQCDMNEGQGEEEANEEDEENSNSTSSSSSKKNKEEQRNLIEEEDEKDIEIDQDTEEGVLEKKKGSEKDNSSECLDNEEKEPKRKITPIFGRRSAKVGQVLTTEQSPRSPRSTKSDKSKKSSKSSEKSDDEKSDKSSKSKKSSKSAEKSDDEKSDKSSKSSSSSKREVTRSEGVKLGLGDFIFYGILITRAARVGWDISVLCMLAVVLGLSLTLVCLAYFERPLPALPFSLFLGIIFYITGAMTFRPFATNLRKTFLVL